MLVWIHAIFYFSFWSVSIWESQILQIQPTRSLRSSFCFTDGYWKCESHRKLKFIWHICRNHWNTCKSYPLKFRFKIVVSMLHHRFHKMSCTVAKPWWIDVSEENDRNENVQWLNVQWHTVYIQTASNRSSCCKSRRVLEARNVFFVRDWNVDRPIDWRLEGIVAQYYNIIYNWQQQYLAKAKHCQIG